MIAPSREEGAALLAVLLLVAIMAALSAVAVERLRLSTRLAANGAALAQARAYALGAEALALSRVGALARMEPGRGLPTEQWNGRQLKLPIPGGLATLRLRDGANCFNLNSLVSVSNDESSTLQPQAIEQFVMLMKLRDIPEAEARAVAAAAADWIDPDDRPLPGGAEDDTYSRQPRPYRAANRAMAEPSELRAVAGMTPALYAALRPLLCALPDRQLSPININSLLPEEADLLVMLVGGRLGGDAARRLLLDRPLGGWGSTATFWKQPALAALAPDPAAMAQVQLKTRWFALDVDVELAGARLHEAALIEANSTGTRLVLRRWGEDE